MTAAKGGAETGARAATAASGRDDYPGAWAGRREAHREHAPVGLVAPAPAPEPAPADRDLTGAEGVPHRSKRRLDPPVAPAGVVEAEDPAVLLGDRPQPSPLQEAGRAPSARERDQLYLAAPISQVDEPPLSPVGDERVDVGGQQRQEGADPREQRQLVQRRRQLDAAPAALEHPTPDSQPAARAHVIDRAPQVDPATGRQV
jgi:hypothetical protein